MLAKSSASAGAGEVTIVKNEPGISTVMEDTATQESTTAVRVPLKLKGWTVVNDKPSEACEVELLDKAGGTILAKVAWQAFKEGVTEKANALQKSSETYWVPQGITGGQDAINVSTGEIVVKRTGAGKSTVIVYYEQQ